MGISEYDIRKFIPEGYENSLPTIEAIEAELGDIEYVFLGQFHGQMTKIINKGGRRMIGNSDYKI